VSIELTYIFFWSYDEFNSSHRRMSFWKSKSGRREFSELLNSAVRDE
jgi:hypothetical protein